MIFKSELLDKYFDGVYNQVKGTQTYKGIRIGNVVAKFSLQEDIDDEYFIRELKSTNLEQKIRQKVASLESRSFLNLAAVKAIFLDIGRYFWHFRVKNQYKFDVYFFISNPKYLKYLDPLYHQFRENGVQVGYIFWHKKNIPLNFDRKIILLKPAFPSFFSSNYWTNHEACLRVDRFINVAKNISNANLILVEGCDSATHIIAAISEKYKYTTACIQWGFVGRSAIKVGWRHMPYDKFLVWGDLFKDTFKKYNPNLNISVTGHPNLLTEKQTLKKDFVLVALQRVLGDHIKDSDIHDFLVNVYQLIEDTPNQQFVLRTHPDLPFDKLPLKPTTAIQNLVIHEYSDFTLNDSFEGAKMCIGISSTTIMESVALNCYPAYVKCNSLPLQIHDIFTSISSNTHVFDFDELSMFLANFNYDDYVPVIQKLKKRLFADNVVFKELLG
jgi:hypothetical protein